MSTWFVIVTRKHKHPISHHVSIEDAGNKIYRERTFHKWEVLAADGAKNAPMRPLTQLERQRLERRLYPTLFGE